MAKGNELRIEYLPLDDVRRWPRNPKLHDDTGLEKSLRRFGFVAPLLQDERTGKLVAGHGRLTALESLRDSGEAPPSRVRVDAKGRWLVPVVRGVDFASAAEAEAYLLADNRLVEAGGWDQDLLREIVRDLDAGGSGLDGLGWSVASLEALIAEVTEAVPTTAAAAGGESVADLAPPVQSRMVPIYLDATSYQPTLDRLQRLLQAHRLTDYTAALLFLLDHYDGTREAHTMTAAVRPPGADPFEAVEELE